MDKSIIRNLDWPLPFSASLRLGESVCVWMCAYVCVCVCVPACVCVSVFVRVRVPICACRAHMFMCMRVLCLWVLGKQEQICFPLLVSIVLDDPFFLLLFCCACWCNQPAGALTHKHLCNVTRANCLGLHLHIWTVQSWPRAVIWNFYKMNIEIRYFSLFNINSHIFFMFYWVNLTGVGIF